MKKSILLLAIALVIILSGVLPAAAAVSTEYNYTIDQYSAGAANYDLQTGWVDFPLQRDEKIGSTAFFYSDGYFAGSPIEYNKHLSTFSAIVSALSGDADGNSTEALLKRINFTSISTSSLVIKNADPKSGINVTFGVRDLTTSGGKPDGRTVLAVSFGDGMNCEMLTPYLSIGETGEASGLAAAAAAAKEMITDFVSQNTHLSEQLKDGKLYFWLNGRLMGGTIANLTAKNLIDSYGNRVFCYTIGSMQAGSSSTEKSNNKTLYSSIHNVISTLDISTRLFPTAYGFKRYGSDHTVYTTSQSFKSRISIIAPPDSYYDTFHAAYCRKLTIWLLSDDDLSFPDSFIYCNSPNISITDYFSDLFNNAVGQWMPNRSTDFVNRTFYISGYDNSTVTLEQAVSEIVSIIYNTDQTRQDQLKLWLEACGDDISDCASPLIAALDWHNATNYSKKSNIKKLWAFIEDSHSSMKLSKIIGSNDYEILHRDFPVLVDFAFTLFSRDYSSDHSGVHVNETRLYLISTLIYNDLKDNKSLLYQSLPHVYIAGLEADDDFYTKQYTQWTKEISSLYVSQSNPTAFLEGQYFDPARSAIGVKFSDGSSGTVNTYEYDNKQQLKKSDTLVNVSLYGKKLSLPITVITGEPVSISITKAADKLDYFAGQTFDPQGMVVTGVFAGGYSIPVYDFTCCSTPLSIGDTRAAVSYHGLTVQQNIAVHTVEMPQKSVSVKNGCVQVELDLEQEEQLKETLTVQVAQYCDGRMTAIKSIIIDPETLSGSAEFIEINGAVYKLFLIDDNCIPLCASVKK